ncbi:MAG: hypothetical protein K5705_07225 [Oscillospiraceae bacterium]|nr:hypothetical protein [Oscillospiraceae bacterium]
MKIEPRKTASLPKYALLLAASAALLTGCDFNRPVATDGTAPDPNVQIDGDVQIIDQPDPDIEVQLAGEEQFCPDMTTTTTEVMLEGEANPYETDVNADGTTVTTAQNRIPDIAGVIDARQMDDDPLMLDGDVDVVIPEDDTHATDYALMQQRRNMLLRYQPCFEAAGFHMEQGSPILTDCWFDMRFSPALLDNTNNVQVIFFDGTIMKEDENLHTWLCGQCTGAYDWGGVLEQEDASGGSSRVLFIDMSRTVADYAADTAQIVKDAGL